MSEKEPKKNNTIENISVKLTRWIGTPQSVLIHTVIFICSFLLIFLGVETDKVLLVLTTAVSLEAIYLAVFIQMTVNRNTASLEAVEEDLDDIQEDVEELSEDVEELSDDVEELSDDVEEISEDVEDISEDIDKIQGEDLPKGKGTKDTKVALKRLEVNLTKIQADLELLKKKGII